MYLKYLFDRLDSDHMPQKLLKEEAQTAMQELKNLAQQTSVCIFFMNGLFLYTFAYGFLNGYG